MHPHIAELIGTFILILLGGAVNANLSFKTTKGYGGGWVTMSLGWGLAVFVAVFITGQFSGAHLNPAVTLGMAIANRLPWYTVPGYLLSQLIGAYLGAAAVYLVFIDHFKTEKDPKVKLGVFSTAPAIANKKNNFISEMIGTFALVFPIFYLVSGKGLGSLDALPVGLLVVVIGMGLGGTTGYAINPARDLGPRLFHATAISKSSDWQYSWIPVIGPFAGGALAALIYLTINYFQ